MKTIILALVSGILMLCLPTWISGEPYPALTPHNFKQLKTYTEPYYQLLQRIEEQSRPKKTETVVVSAWQDSAGNMHFSSQGQAPLAEHTQQYEVKSYYSGRFALPPYWAWTSMLAVWLFFYLSILLCSRLLFKRSQPVKQARTVGVGERESDQEKTAQRHIEYEQARSADTAPSRNRQAKAAAHRILGTQENASAEEIKLAYHSKMKQYHPDKVAHLGQELQDVARKKAVEINHAYALLVQ